MYIYICHQVGHLINKIKYKEIWKAFYEHLRKSQNLGHIPIIESISSKIDSIIISQFVFNESITYQLFKLWNNFNKYCSWNNWSTNIETWTLFGTSPNYIY